MQILKMRGIQTHLLRVFLDVTFWPEIKTEQPPCAEIWGRLRSRKMTVTMVRLPWVESLLILKLTHTAATGCCWSTLSRCQPQGPSFLNTLTAWYSLYCLYHSAQRRPDYMVSHGTPSLPVEGRMSPLIFLLVNWLICHWLPFVRISLIFPGLDIGERDEWQKPNELKAISCNIAFWMGHNCPQKTAPRTAHWPGWRWKWWGHWGEEEARREKRSRGASPYCLPRRPCRTRSHWPGWSWWPRWPLW